MGALKLRKGMGGACITSKITPTKSRSKHPGSFTWTGRSISGNLGGLPTADGRTVRRGRIYRSDVLYRLTPDDVLALHSLGIRTVLDLRSRREVEHYPQSALVAGGIRHANVPLVVDPPVAGATLLEDYLLLLHHAGAAFWTIFDHLARDPYPVIINCFAGKDRTGLATALILGALGVPDDVIVADYALSERHMARHLNLHRASDDVPEHTGPLPDWLVASPATMTMTLGALAAEWGSVRGYLDAIGVPADDLRCIRDALVEPPEQGDDVSGGCRDVARGFAGEVAQGQCAEPLPGAGH